MLKSKELNKSFDTKENLFLALKENKELIIEQKKANIYKSCNKGASVSSKSVSVLKGLEVIKSFEIDNEYYYVVVNTTKVLDSHSDLHVNGIWNKTVKEQQGKNYLVFDHKLEVEKVIAKKEHVEMFIANIPFSAIGKDYKGETEALIYKIKKDKVTNPIAKEWLDSGDSIEASVRMQYVNIELAMNSTDKNDIAEKKVFDTYFDEIANKENFENIEYFFVVTEAKNVRESSLVVFGSNEATGIIENKEEPSKDTPIIEPSKDTQASKRKLSII